MSDAFQHHPNLRGKIADPETSFFRDFSIEAIRTLLREHGLPVDWWYPDEHREAIRRKALQAHTGGDLWVFAYGSLMWDPGFRFAEIRRAYAPGHSRRFILRDIHGARGVPDAPGLMAALDAGDGCEGLLFRIAADQVDAETQILCRRELIEQAYLAQFIEVHVDGAPVTALTFVADHSASVICADLTRAEQVHLIATGRGIMGTSHEYLSNIATQFETLGIHDPDVADLMAEVQAYSPGS